MGLALLEIARFCFEGGHWKIAFLVAMLLLVLVGIGAALPDEKK